MAAVRKALHQQHGRKASLTHPCRRPSSGPKSTAAPPKASPRQCPSWEGKASSSCSCGGACCTHPAPGPAALHRSVTADAWSPPCSWPSLRQVGAAQRAPSPLPGICLGSPQAPDSRKPPAASGSPEAAPHMRLLAWHLRRPSPAAPQRAQCPPRRGSARSARCRRPAARPGTCPPTTIAQRARRRWAVCPPHQRTTAYPPSAPESSCT
mmetsp:Transcript_77448/g.185651  ORF Transcript_77448/g.185651 Transcript_77448/m.185651 type:complete len:209 (-) Transcript_77448:574-1200(-)